MNEYRVHSAHWQSECIFSEEKKGFLACERLIYFNCNSQITLWFYLTKPKENGTSTNNDGVGAKIPRLGYLDPHPNLHFENLKEFFFCL